MKKEQKKREFKNPEEVKKFKDIREEERWKMQWDYWRLVVLEKITKERGK